MYVPCTYVCTMYHKLVNFHIKNSSWEKYVCANELSWEQRDISTPIACYVQHHITVSLCRYIACEDRTCPLAPSRSILGSEYWWINTTAPTLPLFTLVQNTYITYMYTSLLFEIVVFHTLYFHGLHSAQKHFKNKHFLIYIIVTNMS